MRRGRVTAITMGIIAGICMVLSGTPHVSAADTATLRVISTTDLHNQVSSIDYEEAGINNSASLAKLSTLIKSAREEVADGTSITVDAGDSVYGYAAEYLYNKNKNIVQPIYAGMSRIGYDAIVLGNHDFDFGFDYIQKQLNLSGLSKICLVSNVVKYSDGKAPWAATKMITRTLTTSQGKQVSIKIGIVGATRPSLSSTYDCDGELVSRGIISSVQENAAALKKAGAQVIVAVVHAGMGDERSKDADYDVVYQLTKLKDVDCIMGGHPHRNFPSTDRNVEIYYNLPGVNRNTGLINGKPVVYVADHAKGIGIADLTLSINGSRVECAGARTDIRRSSAGIAPDPVIESVTDQYDAEIRKGYDAVVAKLPEGERITGYFALSDSNYAYQLNNEAKIQFGMEYQMSREGKKYADYGVLSYTKTYMEGSSGPEDYFDISGNITWGDLLNVQRYEHNWNYIYWLTGAQLKEWLEWSASVYAQNGEIYTSNAELNRLTSGGELTSLLSNTWGTYGSFAHFDGVEYELDITGPAKYDSAGNLIDPGANRVKKLTYNGKNVGANTKFLVVSNALSSLNPVLEPIQKQKIMKKIETKTVEYLRDYIKQMGAFQDLSVSDDHNWFLRPNAGQRIVHSSPLAESLAETMPWYQKTLSMTSDYGFFQADFSGQSEDVSGPLLVLASSTKSTTNENVVIKVQATDVSGIHSCKYLFGNYQMGDEKWKDAVTVTNGQVSVSVNGTYSFLATDSWGNTTLRHITVNNINPKKLAMPEVEVPTNKQTKITGYTKAGLTVRIIISGKTYTTTAKSNGSFSCEVGKHFAGTTVRVYVEDRQGRRSDSVYVKYDRTGPNAPTLKAVTNKTKKLKGTVSDTGTVVIAYVGSEDVYVPEHGGVAIYKNSKKYDADRRIIPTAYKRSGKNYTLKIPEQNARKKVKVMAIDVKGRVSLAAVRTITQAAPNKPTVNTVCDAEKAVTGKIPSTKKKCKVTVKVGAKRYSAKSQKNGRFEVETRKLKSGMKLSVYASDTSKGKTRKSASTSCQVASKQNYVKNKHITVKGISSKTTQIRGSARKGTTLYFNYGSSYTKLVLNKNGKFYYTLPKTLKAGQVVYFVNRKNDGSIIDVKQMTVKKAKGKAKKAKGKAKKKK